MLLANELLRGAAAIVEAGWSQDANARDAEGNDVPLFLGSAKAGVNPAAARFSLYGAVCKAGSVASLVPVWAAINKVALRRLDGLPLGGKNFVHPALQYNNMAGRTAAEVASLLIEAAEAIEAAAP